MMSSGVKYINPFLFMPTAPPRPCTFPGCGTLTFSGRCDKHKRVEARQHDQQRGSAHSRGYTAQWQRYRAHWLREHPLCGERVDGKRYPEHSYCAQQDAVVAGDVVDHIRPHRGDECLMWGEDNHQTLCRPCHNRKTATEDGGFGNRAKG